MTRLLRSLAVAAVAVLVPALPAAATTAPVPVEAELMTVTAGRAPVFADAAAAGGRARVLVTNGALSGVVRTPAPARRLLLRLRGDQAAGAPRAVVLVDGRQVGVLDVANRAWSELGVAGSWAAGAHTVVVRFVNDHRTATADRNLRVDRVRFSDVTSTTAASTLDDAYEARVVQLVNGHRAAAGLRPLAVSSCADRYAEAWGAHLATVRTLVHRSDLGSLLGACGATAVAENIAYGGVTADQLVAMWMGSSGHRANILNASYTHVGTGATRAADGTVWATQNFLRIG